MASLSKAGLCVALLFALTASAARPARSLLQTTESNGCARTYDASLAELSTTQILKSTWHEPRSTDGKHLDWWGRYAGASANWTIEGCAPGQYTIRVGYAMPDPEADVSLLVDGATLAPKLSLPMPFSPWAFADAVATLSAGRHVIGLHCNNAHCPPIDVIVVTSGTVVPEAAPQPVATQPTRLRVVNKCAVDLWMASSNNLPESVEHSVHLPPGGHYDYNIPAQGLYSTRFWPKLRCDGNGEHCVLGDIGAPPIDSKLEVSWGCTAFKRGSKTQCAGGTDDTTWWNLSQVDGYTLPFKVIPTGNDSPAFDCPTITAPLSVDRCPSSDDLSHGLNGVVSANYSSVDLRARDPATGDVLGCMSPCMALNFPQPWGKGLSAPGSDAVAPYCCPTPPVSPEQCRKGPVIDTKFVRTMHDMAPQAYAYAYDDAAGLHTCSASTSFELQWCP